MLEVIIPLLQYGIPAAVTLWGAVAEFRARRYRRALDLSDQTLRSIIAGVEVWGRTPGNEARATSLKTQIEAVASLTGSEREKLAPLVQSVVKQLESAGVFALDAKDQARISSAVGVIKAVQAERKAGTSGTSGAALALLIVGALGLSGCATFASGPEPERVTVEDRFTVDGEEWISVAWPEGTNQENVFTRRGENGQVFSVSPMNKSGVRE